MTEFNHDFDRLIKDILGKDKQLSTNELWKKTGIPHGTFFSHFNNLKKAGQIEPEEDPTWKNGKYRLYCLTESTKTKRNWGLEEPIKSRREPRNSSLQRVNETENQKMKKVILFLLLSQAAKGSGRLKPAPGPPQVGELYVYNPITQKSERCEYFEEKGVTTNDIIEHKDVGNGRAFAHVNFTETEVEDCLRTLREHELSNVIMPISKERDKNTSEIAFEIKEGLLRDIIKLCLCIIHQVATRIEYYWLYKRRRITAQGPDFEWYVSFFGEKRTYDLIKRAKVKRTRVQDAERIIKQCDKEIIRLYHEHILCDKYKVMPDDECIHDYEKHRRFVKNMPQNYRFLVDTLIQVVYPPFLQKLHKTDPELLKFTKSLRDEQPAIPLK